MASQTVTVKLSPKAFEKGLKYAKQVNGVYNPATKTWAIPAGTRELGAAASYGWIIVDGAPAVPAPTEQADATVVEEIVAAAKAMPHHQIVDAVLNLEKRIEANLPLSHSSGKTISIATMRAAVPLLRAIYRHPATEEDIQAIAAAYNPYCRTQGT